MISFITILNVFILSATSQDCPLTMKYLQKKTGLMKIESTPVQSLMDCVAICLHRYRCEAVTLMTNQCTLYSTSESYKNKGFAFHVGNISWPQRFVLWKGSKMKHDHVTTVSTTTKTYPTTTLPTTETTSMTSTTTTTTAASTTACTTSTISSTTTPTSTTTASTTLTSTTTKASTTTRTSTTASITTSTTTTTASTTTSTTTSTTSTTTTALASTVVLRGDKAKVTKEGCAKHKLYSYLSGVGMCIRYVDDRSLTWSKARAYCRQKGGDLVTLNTEEKYEKCYSHIKSKGRGGFGSFGVFGSRVWIGLQISRKESKWVDGSPMTYTKTGKSKSARFECVQIGRGFLKKWFLKNCNTKSELFLCEIV